MKTFDVFRAGGLEHCFYFLIRRVQSITVNAMTQVADRRCHEGALRPIQANTKFLESYENRLQIPHVLLCRPPGDYDIIQIGSNSRQTLQDLFHSPLKYSRGRAHAERQPAITEKTDAY